MRWVYFLVGSLVFGIMATASRASAPEIPEDVKQAVRDRVRNGFSPGIAVGMVGSGGTSYFSFSAGAPGGDDRVSENTIFEIGSITKVFTALVLADMVERGEVRFDDPIGKFLPQEVRVPTRNGRTITLKDLAGHRSGLPRMPSNFQPKDGANPYADYTQDRLYDFLSHCTLQRDIGSAYEYSNLGAGLLGHILARASGESYEALIVERICAPLQMNDTRITLSPEQRGRLVAGHNVGGAVDNWDFDCLAGCGALRSSARDMLRFLAAAMDIQPSKLNPAMKRLLQERNLTGTPGLSMGLGWHIWQKWPEPGREIVWHNGGTGGYHSFCGFLPSTRTGAVVLANSTDDIDDIGLHLLDSRFGLKPVRKAAAVPADVLEQYVGDYEVKPGVILRVTIKGGTLCVQRTGQDEYPVYPESETEFFYRVTDAQITFVKDAGGKVTGLTLHQGGVNQTARKIR